MVRFKVKPRKTLTTVPCTAELTALLACFATSADIRGQAECAAAAKGLHACMSEKGRTGKAPKSSINYLLSKIK